MTPQTIGRYNILRELGHGAMGVVYEAEDPNIGRHVALKVVRTDQIGANRDEVFRRFKNEARAAGNLNHPNIITIHDAGEHEGMLFIAMEYVAGKTLAEIIKSTGRVPPDKSVEIIRQVCAGLDFAHARGIIHRDIKPANIMLADSVAKITDFGIANVGDGMTITGTVVGTPNYMSPEQVLGKTLDGRSDLFSVAVILYEMLTGERPFEGQSITTILYKIVHEEAIAPRKLDATIHPGLSAIIEKGMAKAPEARFASGSEFAATLENYKQLGSGPVTLGSIPTASIPETAALTQATLATVASGQSTMSQTLVQGSATVVAPTTVAVPEAKKKGFSTFLMGCFGLIALGIVALTIVTLVAIYHQKEKKAAVENNPSEAAKAAPADPNPPPAAPAAVVKTSPAKPAKTTATLQLSSTPPGAEILLDGTSTQKETPASITIPRGEHTIAVRMPGFQESSAKFKVAGGEEFEFTPELVPLVAGMPKITIPNVPMPDLSKLQELQRNPALSERQRDELKLWEQWSQMQKAGQLSIMVNSRPPGATIFIDGKDTGKKTPEIIRSEAGRYTVRLELDGYNPFERTVNVAPNRGPTSVNVRLTTKGQ